MIVKYYRKRLQIINIPGQINIFVTFNTKFRCKSNLESKQKTSAMTFAADFEIAQKNIAYH